MRGEVPGCLRRAVRLPVGQPPPSVPAADRRCRAAAAHALTGQPCHALSDEAELLLLNNARLPACCVWNTGGRAAAAALGPRFFSRAAAALLVYDPAADAHPAAALHHWAGLCCGGGGEVSRVLLAFASLVHVLKPLVPASSLPACQHHRPSHRSAIPLTPLCRWPPWPRRRWWWRQSVATMAAARRSMRPSPRRSAGAARRAGCPTAVCTGCRWATML